MSKTLFISKEVKEDHFIQFCASRNITLVDIPMISFKQMEFKTPPKEGYEALFFSSERSVDFFLTQELPNENHLLCCIGQKTADALKKWGYEAHFIGERSGEPNSVAKQLCSFLGNKTVLFPQSSISNKSVQKEFDEQQCINLVVYETFALPHKLKVNPEILVFTSPSNVRSFLQMNTISENQKVIAWGESTAHYLRQSNIYPDFVLAISSLEELQNTLSQLQN
jgi:uroporphyrinogen-III synthase